MFDEMQRLTESSALCALLNHYADLSKDDREVWQHRVMEMEEIQSRELVKLHGELLAYGWLEQNTGNTPTLAIDQVQGCYRITRDGIKALKSLATVS